MKIFGIIYKIKFPYYIIYKVRETIRDVQRFEADK